ncbi:uncharacterized protein EV154DRAFT_532235 [Mucor mucedo]|uniref:uncharacterized protein n=1 Tax=Mucor mucedo TaxID=29922 RepID=UPI00221FF655|nr:uncharacterized protein EV154DRAFT_532235 [Mucor mucedo]KAI7867086.1 hypothetical protein EV154DRAFT_532235 [Mucor mucedo]
MTYQPNYFNGDYSSNQFSQVLFNPMEDWFNPTDSNSDLLSKQTDAFQDLFQLLPISPPLTASPAVSVGDHDAPSVDLVALFPDILNHQSPKPVQVQPQPIHQRRPIAIMPKTAIPIAPRPGAFTPTMNTTKRKLEIQQDSDEVSQKRQKNTDAARRSRLKKIVKMETLEKQVHQLESDNSRLTTRVAVLESEKVALHAKDVGLEDRIRVLEAQLAEAHRALTSKSQ